MLSWLRTKHNYPSRRLNQDCSICRLNQDCSICNPLIVEIREENLHLLPSKVQKCQDDRSLHSLINRSKMIFVKWKCLTFRFFQYLKSFGHDIQFGGFNSSHKYMKKICFTNSGKLNLHQNLNKVCFNVFVRAKII